MRVLVTGANGALGRVACRHLVRAGADVVAFSRDGMRVPGTTALAGDVRDVGAIEVAVSNCDGVLHLAWDSDVRRSVHERRDINIGGTANVVRAVRAGRARLVVVSSASVYGPSRIGPNRIGPSRLPLHEDQAVRPDPDDLDACAHSEAEDLVLAGGIESVVMRPVVVVGRTLAGHGVRWLAGPVLLAGPEPECPHQFLHESDFGRFCVEALAGSRTGVVNVGPADGGLDMGEVARVLGRRLVRLPPGATRVVDAVVRRGLAEPVPSGVVVDTTCLRTEWGFEATYGSREALASTQPVVARTRYFGAKRVDNPWRLAEPTHRFHQIAPEEFPELIDPAPPGVRGSFDGYVLPSWPLWSSTNVSEAFPGPMTPLSLSLALDILGCAGAAFVSYFGLTGEVATAQTRFPCGAFGHRLYANISVVRAMAEVMPGTDPDAIEEQFIGRAPESTGGAHQRRARLRDLVRSLTAILPRTLGLQRELRRLEERVANGDRQADGLVRLDDDALRAWVERCHDEVIDAWVVSTSINLVAAGIEGAVAKMTPEGNVGGLRGGTEGLRSARLATGVEEIARLVRRDEPLVAKLRDLPPAQAVEELASLSFEVSNCFDALLRDVGHRGPGETELENETFGDRPDLLLGAIVKALDAEPRPVGAGASAGLRVRIAAGVMHRWLRRRERARDAVARQTHALRLAVRELGRRAAAAGDLADAGDVFYLDYDELFAPALHASKVPERRRERERLRAIRLPRAFELRWEPVGVAEGALTALSGLGVSPGVVEGTARVVADGDAAFLDPGEVLVAHVTDVGWTSLFTWAAAVVTDIGGTLSHAAIVAREIGIPCVVGTEHATQALRTGQRVRVDGTAGTVEIIE